MIKKRNVDIILMNNEIYLNNFIIISKINYQQTCNFFRFYWFFRCHTGVIDFNKTKSISS